MPMIKITIGFILIFAGCHIPWFFAGSAGLLLGDYIGMNFRHLATTQEYLINDLQYGVLAALLAFLYKRLAGFIGGALLGAFLVYNLPPVLGWNMDWFSWPYFIIAAVIGILLVYFGSTFAVITISTFSGAILIVQNSNIQNVSPILTLVVLIMLGVATQFILLRYYEPTLDETKS